MRNRYRLVVVLVDINTNIGLGLSLVMLTRVVRFFFETYVINSFFIIIIFEPRMIHPISITIDQEGG